MPERVSRARCWNATYEEWAAGYPCDDLVHEPFAALVRAIDVDAPPAVVYRWLCQLRVAPYSYDLVDNLGRPSPRRLVPGLENLEPGQQLMVVEICDFETDRHISGRAYAWSRRVFGLLSLTYQVTPQGTGSRLVARLDVEDRPQRWRRARVWALGWGDLVMMRKQLRTVKALAESSTG